MNESVTDKHVQYGDAVFLIILLFNIVQMQETLRYTNQLHCDHLISAAEKSLLLAPTVFLPNLLFFCWCEVIFDVECFTNFFWRLSFNHVGNSFA